MKNTIAVTGIDVYAFHGCNEAEGELGGKYIVDVELMIDFSPSSETDDLSDTIDYVEIRKIVSEEMSVRSKLIEHVGYRIQQRFKSTFNRLISSKITVRKLNPPIGGNVDEVSITIEG